MLSILKKMDMMLDSTERTYEQSLVVLGNIEGVMRDDLGAELKKQTKILMNIESKIEKLGQAGSGGGGGDSGGGGGGFMKAVGEIPKILMDMIKVLAVAGLLTDILVDGAKAIAQSIRELLNLANGVDPAKAAISLLYFKGLAIIKFGDIAENLKKFASVKVFVGAAMLPWVARGLNKFIDGIPVLFLLTLIDGKKVESTLTGLGRGLQAIAESIMNTGPMFGLGLLIRAWVLTRAVKLLLSYSSDIKPVDALLSVAYFRLLGMGELGKLTEALSVSIGVAGWIGSPLVKRAKAIASATRILLGVGNMEKKGFFGDEPIKPIDALLSVGYFKLLTIAGLDKLTEALAMSVGVQGIFGDPLVKRARSLAQAARILLSTGSDKPMKSGLFGSIDPVTPQDALLSALYFFILGHSKLTELTKALTGTFMQNLFGDKFVKRAISLRDATRILLKTSEGIEPATALKSVLMLFLTSLSISKLVKNLSMAALLAPLVIIGVKVMQFSLKSLLTAVNDVSKDAKTIIASGIYLVLLSSTIGTLVLITSIAGIAAPLVLIGSLVIGFMMNTIVKISQKMKKVDEKMLMSKIDAFVLAMTGIVGLITLVVAAEAVKDIGGTFMKIGMMAVLTTMMALMLIGIGVLIKKMDVSKMDMFVMALTNLVQAVTLVIASEAMKNPPKSFQDVLLFGAMMLMLSLNMVLISKFANRVKLTSVMGLLVLITGLILLSSLVIWFARGVGIQALLDVIIFSTITAAIALTAILISKFVDSNVGKMIKTVLVMGLWVLGMIFVGLAVKAFAGTVSPWDVLLVTLTLGALALIFYLTGKVFADVLKGAFAIAAASLSILILSFALSVWMGAKVKWEDLAILGVAIVGMAAIGLVAGLGPIPGFIMAGSVALILASVAVILIATGLKIWTSAKVKMEDVGTLGATIAMIGVEFGLLGFGSFFILAGAAVMTAAGLALLPISHSLKRFKEIKFGKSDADNLEYVMGSVVRAFGIVTDYERQKKMGFYVNPWDLMIGIQSLSGAGRVLAGLAEGVQAWANLEVSEWEVVNPGTKDAKLVIKNKRKLTKTDFENAAYGMAQVITAISKPFADVGRQEKAGMSGNPLIDAIFGGGFVSTGINALSRAGGTLVGLADGVKAFANLRITEYEVINAGTKDAKLVPKGVKQLTGADLENAGKNIASIISVVGMAFAKIGREEAAGEGFFSGGYVSKGVQALAGVGENLKNITDAVLSMANRQVPQFELINGGTKDAKLVPAKPLIVSDADLTKAANTIMDILGVVVNGIAEVGRMEANSEGWFSDGYVTKGTEALAGLGDTVAKITEAVIKFATGEIQTFDLINPGTKDAKLVPGKPLKINKAMVMAAGRLIGDIISLVGREMNSFGKWIDENGSYIESATSTLPSMTDVIANAAKPLEVWAKVKDSDKTTKMITDYFGAIKDVFDPKKNKDMNMTSWYFTQFATNSEKVGQQASAFDKVANNYDRIQKSMKLMQQHINGMDLKKLTLTDSMMKSIAMLSKNPEAIAKAVTNSIEESFKELIEALKELAKANAPVAAAPAAGSGGSGGDGGKGTGGKDDKSKGGKSTPAPAGSREVSITSMNPSVINELATAIANKSSDRRLKMFIKEIGKSNYGLTIYEYQYINKPGIVYQGVMAQDLLDTQFENALLIDENGYYMVDYSKLDVEFKKIN
jgi:hypothetical protein